MHAKNMWRVPKLLIFPALLLALLALFSGCGKLIDRQIEEQNRLASKLIDLAYGNPGRRDNIIYIQENGEYVPYLVFAVDHYGGNLLIVRQNLTEETVIYEDTNIFGAEGSYYPDSNVDKYLNETFITKFTSALQEAIPTSNVEIAALGEVNAKNPFSGGRYTRGIEVIQRKIFLLSAVEVGIDSGRSMAAKEGERIKALDQELDLFPAPMETWLRSAYLWDDTHAWMYSMETYGEWPISDSLPLRPIFALSPNLAVEKRNGIIQDTPVYVLKIDE